MPRRGRVADSSRAGAFLSRDLDRVSLKGGVRPRRSADREVHNGRVPDMLRNRVRLVCQAFLAIVIAWGSMRGTMAEEPLYDLVVYGPTSAGVAAAVQAKRSGLSVVVVGPDKHLGGMTAGGLGWTDSGNKAVVGGLSREYYRRIKAYYDDRSTWRWQDPSEYGRYRQDDDAQWTFEPHVAERVFEDWIREHEIRVDRDEWLDRDGGAGVVKEGGRLIAIMMESGKTYRGRMFIDATYEGDLLALAGVTYTIGRESNATYGETLNGVQIANAVKHQFETPISAYVVPGDPSSGLLPRVHDGDPGEQGAGDRRVQAYNYRVCLTRVDENRVPFPKPDGYDPAQYELLLRTLQAGSWHIAGKFDMLPNLKTDTNNHGSFSTDNIGMNYDYPEASYERRREILKEHEQYQKGYFYFVANDPRVPEPQRSWMAAWGLAKDEFVENGNWPHQIYVREARRMVGDFVVTENHLTGRLPTPRSIGMGSYNMDSHNVQRYVDDNGHARNEGDVQISPGGPYPIDYGAIVPKKSECENLLVPVCVSSSHIAYGSIRMEPVFMVLGQSAATAAAIALEEGVAVQDVAYETLEGRLLADGQVLRYDRTRPGRGVSLGSLEGIVVDDTDAEGASAWRTSNSIEPFVGSGYRHDGDANKGRLEVRFASTIAETGRFEVRFAYSAQANRATNVPLTIVHAGGETVVRLDQRARPEIDGLFRALGTFRFEEGRDAVVIVSNAGTDGHVVIDAIQLVRR